MKKPKNTHIVSGIAAMIALALAAPNVRATILVNADFDNGYTTGAIQTSGNNGQSGTNDVGFRSQNASGTTGWEVRNDRTPYIVATDDPDHPEYDLTFTTANGGVISGGSHAVSYTSDSTAAGTQVFSRHLETTITGQTFYVRLVLKNTYTSLSTSIRFNFFLNNDSNYYYDGTGIGINRADLGSGGNVPVFRAGGGTNSADAYTQAVAGPVVTGETCLLVARYNWNSETSKYDTVSLWVNPSDTSLDNPASSVALPSAGIESVSRVGISTANMNVGATILFDSFAIGTDWLDVVPEGIPALPGVPEPATYAIAAAFLALITAAVRCRRKTQNE
jgi:hypothetical protein